MGGVIEAELAVFGAARNRNFIDALGEPVVEASNRIHYKARLGSRMVDTDSFADAFPRFTLVRAVGNFVVKST